MNWDLIENNWKQIKASVKQNRGKFNGVGLDNIDNYSQLPESSVKQWKIKVPGEINLIEPLIKLNKSSSHKKL